MDEKHRITFNNGLTDLTIRMTDSFGVACKNEAFPDLPELDYTEMMYPRQVLGIIDILKRMPAAQYSDIFSNRWQEIKEITMTQLSLNSK